MSSGRLVAEIRRKSTWIDLLPPSRSKRRSSSTRSSLACAIERHVADLVEEQRAVVGQLEAAGLAIVRAGERALLVAEDFRLEQRVGQRRAVDGLEVLGPAPRQLVDHARDDFLARAGRAEDQHRDVGLGGGADPLEDDQHLLVAADHLAEALHRRRGVFDAEGGAAARGRCRAASRPARPRAARAGRSAGRRATCADDAELDQLVDAVLDVQPHAAERLHEVLRRRRPLPGRARQEAQDAGAQRRLHQVLEPRFDVGRLGPVAGAARAVRGAPRRSGHPRDTSPAGARSRRAVVLRLVLLDQLLHAHRVGLAVPMARAPGRCRRWSR